VKIEKHILEVWTSWYEQALAKMSDVSVTGPSGKITAAIAEAQRAVRDKNKLLSGQLGKK
jgi:hypothetical protein